MLHAITLSCLSAPLPQVPFLFSNNHPSTFMSLKNLHSEYNKNVIFAFWVWFISLNMMIFSSIHFTENDKITFFFMAQ
jgi:hypothetical protein